MVNELTKSDIDEVNYLGSKLNPKFAKLFHIDSLNSNEKIYVYKQNNKVIGFIHILINFEIVDLLNIYVKEENRNQKIATFLMDYMITDLPLNVERILLEVDENNIPAISFYNRFNFNVINTRNNYYGSNKALIMERKLK